MTKITQKASIVFFTVVVLSAVAFSVYAKDQRQQQNGPPPEAIAACKGKEVGAVVTFKGRKGESLEAVCEKIEGKLVAVPPNGPHKPKSDD